MIPNLYLSLQVLNSLGSFSADNYEKKNKKQAENPLICPLHVDCIHSSHFPSYSTPTISVASFPTLPNLNNEQVLFH